MALVLMICILQMKWKQDGKSVSGAGGLADEILLCSGSHNVGHVGRELKGGRRWMTGGERKWPGGSTKVAAALGDAMELSFLP